MVPLRCVMDSGTKGVTMDSNFLMFLGVMVVIFGGGVYLYMKG